MSLPTPMPNRSMSPSVYIATWNTLLAYLPQFELDMNQASANVASHVAGTAFAIPYTFSSTVTPADPGAGFMRANNASSANATWLILDPIGANGVDYTAMIDNFAASSSAVKGQIRVVKVGDVTKWATWNLTSVTSPTGYKTLVVTPVLSSEASPFANNDELLLLFTRTGDIGPAGTINRRVGTIADAASLAIDINNYDLFTVTALAQTLTFSAPTGTLSEGRSLMVRVKDNGSARSLLWNSVFRASIDLPLPTSTSAGKTLYMGFLYNAADSKWDLVGVLNGV